MYTVAYWIKWKPVETLSDQLLMFGETRNMPALVRDNKLGALVEGAALATKLYLEASAPVPMAAPVLAPTPYRAATVGLAYHPTKHELLTASHDGASQTCPAGHGAPTTPPSTPTPSPLPPTPASARTAPRTARTWTPRTDSGGPK